MTCSANQVVKTDAGRAFATVILPPVASLSDNDGIASVHIEFNGSIYDPIENVTLTPAQSPHLIRYVALDAAGNTDMCSVIITVVGECY